MATTQINAPTPTEIVRADNQATGGGDGSNEVGGLLQARTKTPPSVLKGGGPFHLGASSRGAISVRDFTFDLRDVQAVFSMQ